MDDFFSDNEDLLFQFECADLDYVVKLYEDDFAEAGVFPHAPRDAADARDSYRRVLEIVGRIGAECLAPHAAEVDETGVRLEDGEVVFAPPTLRAWDMLRKAELTGMGFSRKLGGLNLPITVMTMAGEVLSRADASFLNLGLQQDIGQTLERFGTEEQKSRIVPILSRGEEGSAMILTEPDAGSDLQSVGLRARQAGDGTWRLSGVKRFITNGCGRIGLVLARSEDREGARGLSLFLYERDKRTRIRRVEEKLGIHGSPTCEMQFDEAPAELVGERGRGLTKYTMWLMNAARLSVASQAVGIAEAAYRESSRYAREREQFGGPIIKLAPVYEMLADMRVSIEAARSLLYETALVVDLKEGMERIAELHPERSDELKAEIKKYTRLAAMLTPMVKAYGSEMANKVTYDAIQVHGGTGYMRDFAVERHYRDARITNIYEGTTQLQIVAAIGAVMSGAASALMEEYASEDWGDLPASLRTLIERAGMLLDRSILRVKEQASEELTAFHARRLVEMATDVIVARLLARDARRAAGRSAASAGAAFAAGKLALAEAFAERSLARAEAAAARVQAEDLVFMARIRSLAKAD